MLTACRHFNDYLFALLKLCIQCMLRTTAVFSLIEAGKLLSIDIYLIYIDIEINILHIGERSAQPRTQLKKIHE